MPKNLTNPVSRRDFARGVAVAAATSVVPSTNVGQPAQNPASSSPEVDAQYESILRQYGGRLSDAEKADIKRLLGENQKGVAPLRAFQLTNADEPALIFRVFRAD
jgi:hypothetical protein